MSGQVPAKEIKPSELFLKLTEAPFPSESDLDFPRRGPDGESLFKFRIRVLAQSDHDRARMAAHDSISKRGYTPEQMQSQAIREVIGDAVAKELLAMACLENDSHISDPNGNPKYARIFASAKDLGQLAADEISVLFNMYLLVQRKYGPLETSADVDAWVKRLVEGGSGFPLLQLDSQTLASVTFTSMVKMHSLFTFLESQWETLPAQCQSGLTRYRLGTGYWSSPADEYASTHQAKLAEPITLEDAVRLTEKINREDAE